MLLRNKKTGEIVDLYDVIHNAYREHNIESLKDLEDEWEDYRENTHYWYIDDMGMPIICSKNNDKTRKRKEIGNYFETEEEAEKAVEKLKAWKRLQDKGFKFAHCDWTKELTVSDIHIYADIDCEWSDLVEEDLQTVFGEEQ